MDRWAAPVQMEKTGTYNTIEDDQLKQYEDMDYCMENTRTISRRSGVIASSPPPPAPPPMALRGTLKPTHLAIHHQSSKDPPRWRMVGMAAVMALILILMILAIVVFLVMGSRAQNYFHSKSPSAAAQPYLFPPTDAEDMIRRTDMEVSPNYLLTLMITKRKLCLFEASTEDYETSEVAYLEDHIESARLLIHSNLSHAGVPVHPLQFQRYVRSLGVDNDCHIVIYDRGHMVWATYAVWIFKLYGHQRVSLLSGGYVGWKAAQSRSPQYRTERAIPNNVNRQGAFSAAWNDSLIITFDDVFTNTEVSTFDVVDAQTKEEYDGTSSGALYGHIKGATNIPIDAVYDWSAGRWLAPSDLAELFRSLGLNQQRPVIVYCSSSVRSSMIWWSLTKLGFRARLYFGGWAEWVVRAPDYLKVLPH